ncbi:S-layer homology domain-containing protein [Kamptonema animale CS-326]|uniref:S-layer homology domain-containing protein n=1 Tax=Kamptonema animale TaxID=92934 RepID=UPI00232FD15F|nr:S-layer homology domain-containing protein [Kamptonema animale]MDB9510995.1 S-layer homology domain-containing protein [Kamptonema animale CS-326]
MVRIQSHAANASLTIFLLASLTACANSPNSKALEESLAADPQLQESPASLRVPTPPPLATNQSNTSTAKLPPDFPNEIPLYTNAELLEVTKLNNPTEDKVQLRWKSTDPSNYIQNYYQTEFQRQKWEIKLPPTEDEQGKLTATKNNLRVVVSFVPNQKSGVATEFTIEYGKDSQEIATTPEPSNSPAITNPSPSPNASASPNLDNKVISTPKVTQEQSEVPQELRQYVAEVVELGVLKLQSQNQSSDITNTLPEPNKTITRREYARWLVAANNKIYANRPAKQIRLAITSTTAAFTDVPKTDPDFPAIQGLAEAGLIPSSLSGDTKNVKFRPNDSLTRAAMMLWKVPLDTRQALPSANIDAVKERWGFQDTSKIDTGAARAVLADFNNGDLANIRRVFGFTTLFQPNKSVSRAEAAASLWYFGVEGDGVSAKDALQEKSN